jgi:salicylate hydroxylase
VPEQELLDEFSGWGEDTMIILKHLQKPSKWYIHCLNPPLRSYVRERVVLIGDAVSPTEDDVFYAIL